MKATILKALHYYALDCAQKLKTAKDIDEAMFYEAEKIEAERLHKQIAATQTEDLIY